MLSPSTVVDLLKVNKIQKVNLFYADQECLRALMRFGIEVMVGVSNDLLAAVGSSTTASDLCVS
ncbi:putative glucan endo-1,3-beta-D-glucosidase [Helianthus annuus]|nr:putative glucan endo-1,3-beta-D-glucosidase [Helianthus annuus]